MLPLEDVRVLAVEQYGAGPFGTMFLADQHDDYLTQESDLFFWSELAAMS